MENQQSPYFQFELDFVEDNIRCIPMIVRFKLDAIGIKLKLSEWSQFTESEREQLAWLPVSTAQQLVDYRGHIMHLVFLHTGHSPTPLAIDPNPEWSITETLPGTVSEAVKEMDLDITPDQWQQLTDLKRFALTKLMRPGHEHKNLQKALVEFGLSGVPVATINAH